MWYVYLRRDQHYMRSYRTHNLWLDQYQKKIRMPRVHAFHIGLFKRMGKTYSGVSYLFPQTNAYTEQSYGLLVGLYLLCHGQVLRRIQVEGG